MSRLSPLNRKYRQKVRIDKNSPEAVAMCQGCGFWVLNRDLVQAMDYRGGWSPVPTGLWVCATCDDVPQPYFQRQVLPADPYPVPNAFPDPNVTVPNGPANSGWAYLTDTNNNIFTDRAGVGNNPNLVMGALPIVTATGGSTGGFTTASDLNNTRWS